MTPDGNELWLTTQTSNDVAVIRTSDHKLLARVPVGRDPNWVDFTPDGRLAVVSNTGSNDASVIDVTLRKVLATGRGFLESFSGTPEPPVYFRLQLPY